MALPKRFEVAESQSQIQQRLRASPPLIAKRLHALLLMKQCEQTGISKRELAKRSGADPNSIQRWRSDYIRGGIDVLCAHGQRGRKPSVFTAAQQQALAERLHDPANGVVGFVELLDWFNKTHGTQINYKTFHGFVVKRFGAKLKTARKTHVRKDGAAVASFKKTSPNSAKSSSLPPVRASKR